MTFIDARIEFVGDVFSASRASSETRRVIGQQLTGAAFYLEGEMIQATPVGATGVLRASWASEYDPQQMEATVFNNAEHMFPTELGRKAAWVPIKPLQLWVKRKLGISDEKKSLGVAIAISKHKSENPTEGQHFVQKTYDDAVPVLQKNFLNVVGAEIVKSLSQ